MKQRHFGVWVFALSVVFLATGSSTVSGQNAVVDRRMYFTGEQRTNFRLSPRGDVVYFQSSEGRDLWYFLVGGAGGPRGLGLGSLPKQWVPMEDGVLLLEQDSVWRLSLRDRAGRVTEFALPFKATALRLLERTVPHGSKVGLWVEAAEQAGVAGTIGDAEQGGAEKPVSDTEAVGGAEAVGATEVVGAAAQVRASGIWTLDLKTKVFERVDDLPPMENPILDGRFRPTGGTQANEQGGNTLLGRSRGEKDWSVIAAHPMTEDMFTGGFSKVVSVSLDGDRIYYTSNLNSDKTELWVYRPDELESTRVLSHPMLDLLPFGHSLSLQGDVTSVVGLYAKTLRTCLDSAVKEDFDFLAARLKGDVSWGGQTPDGKFWLVRVFTGGPTQYYVYERGTKKLTYVCTDQPTMEGLPLATRHAREVIAKDGTHLPFHVYLPKGSDADGNGIPDRPLPTILYVHGGPWVGVFHWNQYLQWRHFQFLANRGYAVINCEFRGGTGLGKEFVRKSYKTWGTDMLQDNVDVAEWAISQGIALKGKVGIWGWSYGGFAAMSGPALHPKTYACALSMYGISDLVAFDSTSPIIDSFWRERVGDPSKPEEAKLLRKASAMNYVNKIKAPMLLTTGSKDDRIPQPQMGDMAQALQGKGKEVVYFYYPEEGHDYRLPETWISFWAIAEQFLAQHLGGQSQPVGDALEDGGFVVEVGEDYVKQLK